MARNKSYHRAEQEIEEARRSGAIILALSGIGLIELPEAVSQLTWLDSLDIAYNKLTAVPEMIGKLTRLTSLSLDSNEFTTVPNSIFQLTKLQSLNLSRNQLTLIPEAIGQLTHLQWLSLSHNQLTTIPEAISQLTQLKTLNLSYNQLTDISFPLTQLKRLERLDLNGNPLNPELAAANKEGLDAVKAYLLAKARAQIRLNEAKLILIGEGEVGKTCLMDAFEGKDWQEHTTTHGIEIRTITATDMDSSQEITLNGWDFGGQRVYRPTHQLFFSSPAVYLVVWKPREGPQQGFVKEWIKLIKHREPEAKILVVATHGGPQQRQPDIDRQELWDLFGKETVLDFFFVDSKPDENGQRRGINKLKQAIARVAANLPEMGREVPKSFQKARQALAKTGKAYLSRDDVYKICRQHGMNNAVANLFTIISHRLGHLIHYQHDPALRDIVILKPDWLATAISFVLDDEETRANQGLIPFARLSQLWDDPARDAADRYPADLHPIFLRLMERFDLSYRVAGLPAKNENNGTSLIAQLVPDNRPEMRLAAAWPSAPAPGDTQQMQICQIVDDKGQSAPAEGLFYQLIVRLHQYSLGRAHYDDSIHWQRGLVLDDDYNGMARLDYKGNDVHIAVRAPYPEGFLHRLTGDVKYLVESFWEGLRCDVMVPCIQPCGKNAPGTGLYEVGKLIDSKRKNRPDYPCPVCHEWQPIDSLLRNAPAARPLPTHVIDNRAVLAEVRKLHGRFDQVDKRQAVLLSQNDANYNSLIQLFTDEAKEGPRLFSFIPVDRSNFNPKKWIRAKFRLTLWCEHSRLPLPSLNEPGSKKGVYEIELTREWFKKAGPYLKFLTGTLSLALPVASSAIKFDLNDNAYEAIEEQLDLSRNIISATLGEGAEIGKLMGTADSTALEHGESIRAEGGALRELHTLLKDKDPSFGGLVRVRNKRQEFLWVHPQFEGEY